MISVNWGTDGLEYFPENIVCDIFVPKYFAMLVGFQFVLSLRVDDHRWMELGIQCGTIVFLVYFILL